MIDISEFIDMEPWVSDDETFNLSIALFQAGSYFGDNGMLDQENKNNSAHRTSTAVCQEDSVFLKIPVKALRPILDDFPHIKKQMGDIA